MEFTGNIEKDIKKILDSAEKVIKDHYENGYVHGNDQGDNDQGDNDEYNQTENINMKMYKYIVSDIICRYISNGFVLKYDGVLPRTNDVSMIFTDSQLPRLHVMVKN